jgi:hypothetical protein
MNLAKARRPTRVTNSDARSFPADRETPPPLPKFRVQRSFTTRAGSFAGVVERTAAENIGA